LGKLGLGGGELLTCDILTVLFSSDDDISIENGASSEDIRVYFGWVGSQSIYVSESNNKHGEEGSDWKSSKNDKAIGNGSGFPLNKSLRQLLTNLCNNSDYGDKGQTINIVADSGVSVTNGCLSYCLVLFKDVKRENIGSRKIFC
jgi:hypothetical protein